MDNHQPRTSIALATDIVSAYVSNNSVPMSELSKLITDVHQSVQTSDPQNSGAAQPAEKTAKLSTLEIRKSIKDDKLISFEDGKPYKTLRRHLTLRGLTPEQYRTKWGLPADYPMTSAAYSEQRSALAKALGLGQRRNAANQESAAAPEAAPAAAAETEKSAPRGRGRPSKASSATEAAPKKTARNAKSDGNTAAPRKPGRPKKSTGGAGAQA